MCETKGFAIIQDARAGEALGIRTLVLVDRAISRKRWWTSDDASIALRYLSESAAQFAARRLKRNNARVVSFDRAAAILADQRKEISRAESLSMEWMHPMEWDH